MRSLRIDRTEREQGFALLELLVALTILALILAMVPSTLRLGHRAWDTPGDTRNRPETAALFFVTQSLKSALPIYERDPAGLGSRVVFEGESAHLAFVTELATGPFGGGLYRIDLEDRPVGGGELRVGLYRSEQSDKLNVEERALSRAYGTIRFRYFGSAAAGAPAIWHEKWTRHDRLPDLVAVTAQPAGQGVETFTWETELNMHPPL